MQGFLSRVLSFRLLQVILLCGVTGCTNLSNSESSAPTIAVLINRTWVEQDPRGFDWEVRRDEQDQEERFAACVSQAASSMDIPVQVITGTQFRAVVFPDLDPRASPRNLKTLRSLIPDPRFRRRIEAAHIDYIAILGGEAHTSETKGGIGCGGGYGAAACLGILWWDHESKLSALIIDLRGGEERQTQGIDATGTSWFAMLAIFPIGAPSAIEEKGCERFGHAVAKAIGEMHRHGE